MLALLAAICFILATFGAHVADLRLVPFGLFFLSLHHLFPIWPGWHRQPSP